MQSFDATQTRAIWSNNMSSRPDAVGESKTHRCNRSAKTSVRHASYAEERSKRSENRSRLGASTLGQSNMDAGREWIGGEHGQCVDRDRESSGTSQQDRIHT